MEKTNKKSRAKLQNKMVEIILNTSVVMIKI